MGNKYYQIEVSKLRRQLFPKGRIPSDHEETWNKIKVPVWVRERDSLPPLHLNVICQKAKPRRSPRCNAGMRLWVICPECGTKVSAGRLHTHYGYKH